MASWITRVSPEGPIPLEMKWPSGEWKWVDEDWNLADQPSGCWLRTLNGQRQMLRWIPASNQNTRDA